jgi:hypothetical protein
MLSLILGVAAAITGAAAQRPSNTSICDYYTTALLTNNTAENQYTLLTLVVNTAVIGNYTQPNVGIAVPGILAPGTYDNQDVNLLGYFDGSMNTSNRGGSSGVMVNFLDGGGATPLTENMPANNTSSNQYELLTHLYEYFGVLLGCSLQGGDAYPAYSGESSQYNVHKFMNLGEAEVNYFIQQVALSGASFGVTTDDLQVVGDALASLFGYRCAPLTTVVPAQGPALQSICIADDCPLSPNATCDAYGNGTSTGSGNGTSTGSGSGGSGSTGTTTAPGGGISVSATGAATPAMGSMSSAGLVSFAVATVFFSIGAALL